MKTAKLTKLFLAALSAAALCAGGAEESACPGREWNPLFDGKTLKGWSEIEFGGEGEVRVTNGVLHLDMGLPFTGVRWTNAVIKADYEIALDARRTTGTDFFCGLTFPVGDCCASLIVSGWGGGLVGISSIDTFDASENDTTSHRLFENGRWYAIRLRVTRDRIQAWIDKQQVVDADIRGRDISVRPGDIELCQPLGLASWDTSAALRNIRIRKL